MSESFYELKFPSSVVTTVPSSPIKKMLSAARLNTLPIVSVAIVLALVSQFNHSLLM